MMKRFVVIFLSMLVCLVNIAFASSEDLIQEWNEASSEVSVHLNEALSLKPNANYEVRCIAIQQMKSLLEEGKIGSSSALWSIAEAFGFEYDTSMSLNDNADRLFQYVSVRLDWYAADNYDSIAAFITDMHKAINSSTTLKEMGVTWIFDDGDLSVAFENKDVPQIVEILANNENMLDIDVVELYDLLGQIAQYYSFSW